MDQCKVERFEPGPLETVEESCDISIGLINRNVGMEILKKEASKSIVCTVLKSTAVLYCVNSSQQYAVAFRVKNAIICFLVEKF